VWRLLQQYINGAALSLTLSSEDFEKMFLQKDCINATLILNLFDQVATEAMAIVQYGHTKDSKDSVLESVPTEGKNSTYQDDILTKILTRIDFGPLAGTIRSIAVRYTLKVLQSFRKDLNIKLVEYGYRIQRVSYTDPRILVESL